MTRGISINIGINKLSDNYKDAGYDELSYCEQDAKSMKKIAVANGFEVEDVEKFNLIGEPTAENVIDAITFAAEDSNKKLVEGDLLLVTFAGHGSEITNRINGDAVNQTWCLHDRQLIDKELARLWSKFGKGVNILFISDSCHSATIATFFSSFTRITAFLARMVGFKKNISRNVIGGDQEFEKHYWETYKDIINDLNTVSNYTTLIENKSVIVISMSACQDNEEALERNGHGIFTGELKNLWYGTYNPSENQQESFACKEEVSEYCYKQFFDELRLKTYNENQDQTPNLLTVPKNINDEDWDSFLQKPENKNLMAFMKKKPFKI